MYRGLKNGVQDVAVKVLGYSGPAQLQQFEHEIKLLKGISFDRNIIQVRGGDYGVNGEVEFLAAGTVLGLCMALGSI